MLFYAKHVQTEHSSEQNHNVRRHTIVNNLMNDLKLVNKDPPLVWLKIHIRNIITGPSY